jgi:hypothetical protein
MSAKSMAIEQVETPTEPHSYPDTLARPDNVVLVVPHKHGSTGVFRVFSDPRVLADLGMKSAVDIEPLSKGKAWDYAWPTNTHLSPGELAYTRILAPDQLDRTDGLSANHRAVYVHRDPRDVIVSHYFSLRFSHGLRDGINRIRNDLRGMSFSQGIRHVIELNLQIRRYEMQRAWQERRDPRLLHVRYEDFVRDPAATFARVCRHCGADVPEERLKEVSEEYGFAEPSRRKPGEVNLFAHQRSGLPGQWKLYLDSLAVEMLRAEAGALIEQLGYEPFEAQESPAPINDLVIDWTDELEQTLRRMNEALTLFADDRVLFYGAGLDLLAICASTLLYGRSNVLGAIDDNPKLHGAVVGKQCRVYSPDEIESLRPDVIVINSTRCRKELYRQARARVKSLSFDVDVFY